MFSVYYSVSAFLHLSLFPLIVVPLSASSPVIHKIFFFVLPDIYFFRLCLVPFPFTITTCIFLFPLNNENVMVG